MRRNASSALLVFMGILLTDIGIGPTEERVRALMQAREHENVAEARRFIGLANFSCRFPVRNIIRIAKAIDQQICQIPLWP